MQTSVQESPAAVPYQAELAQNYPNPFNGQTVIGYSVPDDGTGSPVPVTIRIFDVLGREVAILLQERKLPGSHSLSYTAGTLPSGVYLCRLEIGNRGAGGALLTRTRKMLLLR